ncbi:MAG TPA: hypothetical protein VEP91_00350 [Solirubrobacterales bacterium]|nr:hypothetical protein [Solirubrobacterales bacterium]
MKKIAVPLVLVLLAALPAAAQARGALDPSFGAGGRVVRVSPTRAISGPTQVVQSPDGTVYALYRGLLMAFQSNGETDPSFGTDGVVPLLDRIHFGYGPRLAIDSQGRLVVAGPVNVHDYGYVTPVIAEQLLAVTRLLPDGSPDPGFNGGEVLFTDLGLPEASPPPGAPASVRGGFSLTPTMVDIDASDRILIAGNRIAAYDANKNGLIPYSEAIVARLDSGGGIDRSYAGGGVARGFAQYPLSASAAAPDGSAYVSYRVPVKGGTTVARIVRLSPNGFPGRGFGGAAGVEVTAAGEVEMTTDGRGRPTIVDPHMTRKGLTATVTRFRLDGRPATAFGRDGWRNVGFPHAKTLLVGIAGDRSGGVFLATTVNASGGTVKRFALAHLNRRGSIDRRFGRPATGFGAGTKASLTSLSVDRLGRPLLGGDIVSPQLPGHLGLAMARYLAPRP